MNGHSPHILLLGVAMIPVEPALAEPPLPVPIAESGQSADTTAAASQNDQHPIRSIEESPLEWVSDWDSTEERMTLPVINGSVIQRRDWLAVLGGFGPNLVTTPAIQIRHPREGWLPVGSQLQDARAMHITVPLDSTRMLVVGGVQGTLGSELQAIASAEVLDPLVAGSVCVPDFPEPLVGHTGHALGNGRAIIIGGATASVFDVASMHWTNTVSLHESRRWHASVQLKDGKILVLGGEGQRSIEQLNFDSIEPSSELWNDSLPIALRELQAVQLPHGLVLVVGGIDETTGQSTDRTWLLNPFTRTVSEGPRLLLDEGVAQPMLSLRGSHVVIVGGERVTPEGRTAANAVRLIELPDLRVWALHEMPNDASRRMWWIDSEGGVAAVSGYRFIPPDEAQKGSKPAGVSFLRDGIRLNIRTLPALRD